MVITVVGLLVGLAMFSSTKYSQTARDSERESKASIIAAALEKYYLENGEYPSCSGLTANPSTVKSTTLTNLGDEDVLKAPLAPDGSNSIKCVADIYSGTEDAFSYTCTNGATPCDEWKLKYRRESDGAIVTITSKYTAANTGSTTLSKPTGVAVSAAMSGVDAVGTGSGASCLNSSPEYQMRHYLNSGSFSATWTNGPSLTVALGEGQSATFQTQARCIRSGAQPSDYQLSGSETVVRDVNPPTGLTTSVTISGSNAVATVNGGTCSAGMTFKRQIRSKSSNVPDGGTYSSWADITTTTQSVPAQEGYEYTFQQRGQCVNSSTGVASAWTTDDEQSATYVVGAITAPAVTHSGNMTNIPYSWSNTDTCPSGTSVQYRYYLSNNGGGAAGWYGPTTATSYTWADSAQGYTFTLSVQARCSSAASDGPWSASGKASYARPVSTPGAPSGFSQTLYNYGRITFTWNEPNCGNGATQQWRIDFANGGGTGIRWINPPSGHEDGWWYGGSSSSISAANPSHGWFTGGPSFGTMGDRNNTSVTKNPPRMNLDTGIDKEFDDGNMIGVAVEYRCYNPNTGVVSGVGGKNGKIYTWNR